MHELSLCQALLRQVLAIVPARDTRRIGRITLRIGPLAGVEPGQLRLAFPLVAAGTACDGAVIEIEDMPVQVSCRLCGEISQVRPNRLLCAWCGTWRVSLLSGDEMLLMRVEFHAAPHARNWERAGV